MILVTPADLRGSIQEVSTTSQEKWGFAMSMPEPMPGPAQSRGWVVTDDSTEAELLRTDLRAELGLPRKDFARLVGLSERTVASWEAGDELKESTNRHITEIARLLHHLKGAFESPQQLATWLKTPNTAFQGSQPLQVIERGELDRLWRMIYFMESGTTS
jgi:DNA-binding XRE family transcriptional regulator